MNDTNIDFDRNDKAQDDLESQLDEAATENSQDDFVSGQSDSSKKATNPNGVSPDLGTAKAQMNQEDGIEIL